MGGKGRGRVLSWVVSQVNFLDSSRDTSLELVYRCLNVIVIPSKNTNEGLDHFQTTLFTILGKAVIDTCGCSLWLCICGCGCGCGCGGSFVLVVIYGMKYPSVWSIRPYGIHYQYSVKPYPF